MPIYEFKCLRCDKEFEYLCFSGGDSDECPSCGGKDVEKLLSSFCSRSTCGVGSGLSGGGASSCAPRGGFS